MDLNAQLDFMRSIPLFAEIEPEDLLEILRIVRPVHLPVGEVLFRQGDPGDAMWVLGQGCEVSLTADRQGDPVLLAILGEGETLGEMALIDDAGRSAAAIVRSPGTAFRIEAIDFSLLREGYHPAAFRVLRRMSADICARLRMVDVRLVPEGGGPPRELPRADFSSVGRVEPAALDAFLPLQRSPATAKLALVQKLREKRLAPGEAVFLEGEPGDAIFLLVEGEIEVQRLGKPLAVLPPGSLFGVVSAIDGGIRSATCLARTGARVWRLLSADFERLFAARNRFAFHLVERVACQLTANLRQANATLMARGFEIAPGGDALPRSEFERRG